MELFTSLLDRMATISPGVRNHIGGEFWQIHIDPDEIDLPSLVLECFSLMIDEVYDIGIEFYCTRADLCDSFYHLDKTLRLFEIIYPTPLYKRITEDDGFKRWTIAVVRDGAGDTDHTSVIDFLHYFVFDQPDANDVSYDTLVFLEDKVSSNPVFDFYIQAIIDTDNTPYEPVVDPSEIEAYLNHVQNESARLLRAIDSLRPIITTTLQLQYSRFDIYRANATESSAIKNYIFVYQMSKTGEDPTPREQDFVARFTKEFDSITPFYEEYFRIQGKVLTRDDVVSLILGCFDITESRDSFTNKSDTVFHHLSDLLPQSDPMIRSFISKVCLHLIQEFYP